MSCYFSELTRWDSTHTRSIRVDYQDFAREVVKNDREYFGITVVTCNEMLASVFGVEVDDQDDSQLRETIDDALAKGDHIFYLEFGDHSSYWCHICDHRPVRSWDSGFAGVMVVHKDAWLNAMPRSTFARSYVSKVIHETFDEWVTAELNGWLYKAYIDDPDGDSYTMGDFLDPEEALKEAMSDHPEIRYSDDDFDFEGTYVLTAEATA